MIIALAKGLQEKQAEIQVNRFYHFFIALWLLIVKNLFIFFRFGSKSAMKRKKR